MTRPVAVAGELRSAGRPPRRGSGRRPPVALVEPVRTASRRRRVDGAGARPARRRRRGSPGAASPPPVQRSSVVGGDQPRRRRLRPGGRRGRRAADDRRRGRLDDDGSLVRVVGPSVGDGRRCTGARRPRRPESRRRRRRAARSRRPRSAAAPSATAGDAQARVVGRRRDRRPAARAAPCRRARRARTGRARAAAAPATLRQGGDVRPASAVERVPPVADDQVGVGVGRRHGVVRGPGHDVAGQQRRRDEGGADGDRDAGGGEPAEAAAHLRQGEAQHQGRHGSSSGAQGVEAGEHGLGRRVGDVAGDPAVGEQHDAVGVGGGRRVVGDHDDGAARARGPSGAGSSAPRRRSGSRGCRSARRRRRRRAGRSARGRSRPAAAGRRTARRAGASSRSARPSVSTRVSSHAGSRRAAGELERQRDVLLGREHRQQVERLEDEADAVAAQPGQRVVVEAGDLGVAEAGRARRSAVSRPASRCIRVDLPEPDGPMIAVNAPGGEVDVDAVERADGGLAACRRPWSGRGARTAPVVGGVGAGGVHGCSWRVGGVVRSVPSTLGPASRRRRRPCRGRPGVIPWADRRRGRRPVRRAGRPAASRTPTTTACTRSRAPSLARIRPTWVLTVASATNRSRARSRCWTGRAPSSTSTSRSRVGERRASRGARAGGARLPAAPRRGARAAAGCVDGAMTASPACTVRIAASISSGGASLSRNPLAPARMAASDVLVEVERGQHDDAAAPGRRGRAVSWRGRREPVQRRHPHVHEHDVGRRRARATAQGLGARRRPRRRPRGRAGSR